MAFPFSGKAQKTEPVFEITAGNVITNCKFLIQASTGELITGNELKLFAIDPEKKTVLWENKDFLMLDEDDISVIDGTPFIKIERQKMISLSKNKNTYIIQARDGKVVYDSKDEGIKVRNTLILQELGGMLIESVKDGFLSVTLVDFATAKEIWTVPLAKEKTGGIGIGAIKRARKSKKESIFNVMPIIDQGKNLLIINKSEIFCINKAGTLAWKKEYDDDVDDAYLSADRKAVFIGYKKYIDKLTTENGSSALAEPIKMRDALNGISPMGPNYLVYNEAGINIMDAAGNMKWKKDTKLGNITQVEYTPNGILAIDGSDDGKTEFFWVDNSGKEIWNEKVDGGIILAVPTDKGVMYVTTERANVLTFEKGKDVWNKDIKIKGTPNFGVDAKTKTLYAFAKEKVHAFNFTDNSYRLVAEGLELKKFDDEKEPAAMDIRENGTRLIINTNQNVAAVQTADGKILYNNYFRDIGKSKKNLMKVAGLAASVGGAYLNVKGQLNMHMGVANTLGGTFAGDDKVAENGLNQFKTGANQYVIGNDINSAGNALFAEGRKRYLASQATKDNLYILSEMPEGNGMLVWNKDKGEITRKITFNDTTPKFVVDEVTDRVYVIVGNVIKAYDLK
jgi:hypothetical protein